jgi:4-hydroxythreonine-4-phosphate dehydrogenase
VVIAAPAFPALGRTTHAGRVFVEGVPLERTEMWRKSGMTGPPDIAGQLRACGLQVAGADLEAVRSESLPRAEAVVCDADREEDLRHVADAGARVDASVIWVGSGGLARHLPPALKLQPAAESARRFVPRAGPVLALVGSRSAVAREQARELCAEPGIECIEVAPDALFSERDVPEARRALEQGRDLVLIIAAGDEVDLSHSLRLATALGRLAAPLVGRAAGAIATGGDIARALLAALGATGVWLAGEVEPGVPIGITDTEPPLSVVTKAGAFGDRSTLKRCRAALGARST